MLMPQIELALEESLAVVADAYREVLRHTKRGRVGGSPA
jgi:hypothetical protein